MPRFRSEVGSFAGLSGSIFLEDVFAASHIVAAWGDASQRHGTDDRYNTLQHMQVTPRLPHRQPSEPPVTRPFTLEWGTGSEASRFPAAAVSQGPRLHALQRSVEIAVLVVLGPLGGELDVEAAMASAGATNVVDR
jgi:hypothetical protein